MSDHPKRAPVLVVVCRCGGWIMVTTIENYAKHLDTRNEVSDLVGEGFELRTPVPFDEYMALPGCTRNGECTTGVPADRIDCSDVDLEDLGQITLLEEATA